MQAVRRASVLAYSANEPITLFSVSTTEEGLPAAEEAVANAKALLKAMKSPVANTRTAFGVPARQIVEAGSAYRVIVVTDEGRSRLSRLIKGSTALEVVRHATTSVLDVR
jgi:nucleotide-binding universal stress UspA family protein